MMYIQEQRLPLTRVVGSSPNQLRLDYVAEQARDVDLNSIVLEARRRSRESSPTLRNLRVATYNVHMWLSVDELNFATDAILEVIRKIDADIIVLNEANGYFDDDDGEDWSDEATDSADPAEPKASAPKRPKAPTMHDSRFERLKNMGYIYSSASFAPKSFSEFLNVVLSKYPITSAKYSSLPGDENVYGLRVVIDTEIDLSALHGPMLRLFATHLDVYDNTENTRTQQAERIVTLSKERLSQNQNELHVILGDFNALRRSDYGEEQWNFLVAHDSRRNVVPLHRATDAIEAGGLFVDSFLAAGAPPPQSTTWSARRVDYIYLSQNFRSLDCPLKLLGSYVFHDSSSDHIPVICDFQC